MKKMLPRIWVLFASLLFVCAIPCAFAGTITYTYDNAGRLIKADYGGGKTIGYSYDNAGNLLMMEILTGTVFYVSQESGCGGMAPCFTTIQSAFNSASGPTTIKITQQTYNENVILDNPKDLTVQGGWNTEFTSCLYDTIIQGSLNISNGKMTIIKGVIVE